MKKISCGIDFGTSNSSAAVAHNGIVSLAPVEGNHLSIPSAIFFHKGSRVPIVGRDAVQKFFERQDGRFMRSLKRVLGTSLMKHGTMVNGKPLKFDKIISSFLGGLRDKVNSFSGCEIESVVMGRPVHFVDNDKEADGRAEDELKAIALSTGFKNIAFQFEPIAAAFAHEINIEGEKLSIVADLGGGTSDFTVIRLSRSYISKSDRALDILANTGVRVGGNDFDKDLNLTAILPEFGYLSTYGQKYLEVPLKYYHDLAEWSKVNFLYNAKNISHVRQLLNESHDKKRFGRLLKVLEQERGHALLSETEDAKIALTTQVSFKAQFDLIERDLSVDVTKKQLEEAIHGHVDKIVSTASECLKSAGIVNRDIELVILTGGSTEVPLVQRAFKAMFPNAALADENKLFSVGLGLAYDSQKKFG